MFYIKPVKQELMYLNPTISMFHDVISRSEIEVVRRLARPRVTATMYVSLLYETRALVWP